jgi:hypothetical protein
VERTARIFWWFATGASSPRGLCHRLRGQLRPLDEKVQGLWDDLKGLQGRIVEAGETLAGDSNRRKAAAVRAVVRRIVCRFRYAQAGSQKRSILTEVRFEPVEGEDKTFVVDGGRGHAVHAESPPSASLLARAFTAEEIDQVKRNLGQVKDLAHSARARLPQISELRQQGLSLSEIGRRLGLSHAAVGRTLGNRKRR